jgi:hypothetical protein
MDGQPRAVAADGTRRLLLMLFALGIWLGQPVSPSGRAEYAQATRAADGTHP